MGTLEHCPICQQPVLELEGQFEVLQPYYARPGDPELTLFGEVHTVCLAGAPQRASWVHMLLRHFTEDRGYDTAGETDGWTVLCHRRLRESLAVHASGASIDVQADAKISACAGGGTINLECDYHLTLPDRESIAALQCELTKHQRIPLARVVESLGIRDKLQWPGILNTGEYVLSRQLRRDWSVTSIAGRMHYQMFVPDPVYALWKRLQ
jgi:hypothetical protein